MAGVFPGFQNLWWKWWLIDKGVDVRMASTGYYSTMLLWGRCLSADLTHNDVATSLGLSRSSRLPETASI